MKLFQVRCDCCGIKNYLNYNGEHWLIPEDWVELHLERSGSVDEHRCATCRNLKITKLRKKLLKDKKK